MSALDDAARAAAETAQRIGPDEARATALSRALLHCAQSIDYSRTGFPQMKPRLLQATIGRIVLRRFLSQGRMSHDTDAPVPGAPEPAAVSVAEAVETLAAAVRDFQAFDTTPAPHFFYGPVTKAEYERLHAMHLANHLAAFATRA